MKKPWGTRWNPQGRESALWLNYWAMENGCKPEPDKLDPTGEQPGWGLPLEAWKYECSAVTNDRGDTRLTLYDVSKRAPFKNNSGEPGGERGSPRGFSVWVCPLMK